MSTLIVFRRIRVENANAIAGLTYGFPAITHFLGFTHALSRKLQASHDLTLEGCGVVSHQHQLHAYGSSWERSFALTRNPLTKDAKTAAFNEEGRMHMTVSLLMACQGPLPADIAALREHLTQLALCQRLAGGTIVDIEQVTVQPLPETEADTRLVMRRLLPGFVLRDRTTLLHNHLQTLRQTDPQSEMLDAWLDFSALKMRAERSTEDNTVQWQYVAKPGEGGFLTPLMIGYRAISPLHTSGEVDKTRDPQTPFCFAEAVYGVGEWQGAHRIHDIRHILWEYDYQDGEYHCRQRADSDQQSEETTYEFDY
ncbi:type I-F CRISPR-associated protein Csy2 [Brenneria roseae subsp. americana]|uniref:Type I-F CRISPR-associated protein Csy2 n=1 Tax=Brenneria roseae subsp. americana TaxID=1508507 RepID=A0A2U1U273_9GAMM|nr:type I-F CRISPR-associated protein Csy2 [Brenneria roseae]PWC15761.1 type I-F CRISPR-associated protein Csy2 [Brenneria roseae subsp. americana]